MRTQTKVKPGSVVTLIASSTVDFVDEGLIASMYFDLCSNSKLVGPRSF